MTWYMKVINDLITGFGFKPTHFPDNDHCNEYVQFFVDGCKYEIENGGPYCSGGAKTGQIVFMYQGGGGKYEITDPKLLEKLTNDIQAIVSKRKLNQS